jgi:hypothetical protein
MFNLSFSTAFNHKDVAVSYGHEGITDVPNTDNESIWFGIGENKTLLSNENVQSFSGTCHTKAGYGFYCGECTLTNGHIALFTGTLDGQEIQMVRYF